jgi:hypothetical protein
MYLLCIYIYFKCKLVLLYSNSKFLYILHHHHHCHYHFLCYHHWYCCHIHPRRRDPRHHHYHIDGYVVLPLHQKHACLRQPSASHIQYKIDTGDKDFCLHLNALCQGLACHLQIYNIYTRLEDSRGSFNCSTPG